VELQGRLKELQDKGLGLAAISYDSPEMLAAFSKQRGITFPLLSDRGAATIKAYGILNASASGCAGRDSYLARSCSIARAVSRRASSKPRTRTAALCRA
jgi:peroxiredoxin